MKNLFNALAIILFVFTNYSCAQQTTIISISEAKKLETNKNEFIGKSLSYFLNHMKVEIKSIIPTPNKIPDQINSLSFIFVKYSDYKQNFYNNKSNTKVTVRFNQNPNLIGVKCSSKIPSCTQWTKNDEKNLADLIVYDIYVTGEN